MPMSTEDLQRFLDVNTGPGAPGGHTLGIPGNQPSDYLRRLLMDPDIQAQLEASEAARRGSGSGSGASARAAAMRALAHRDLDLQRKKLEFQHRTGLRDIEKMKGRALEDVMRNALSRGIFRSGIRLRNEQRVERDAADETRDLQESLDLALEGLKIQRERIDASKIGSGGGGGGGDVASALTLADLAMIAEEQALFSGGTVQDQALQAPDLGDSFDTPEFDPDLGDPRRAGPR